ncbi:SRPBCC family protein [Fodinicola feengrottensis]|uniref:SRPBCC family protein n=1 Tax=Fodinicola feengrottensis TaxID=435914 RepID=A0ABN2H5Y1_9ACTN|nr:SRPBCC family protein [Fodinicola feengrottensis]
MPTRTSEPTASAEITVAATPDEVYALVSDVTRTPEYAVECVRCEWVGGTGPAVGVRFRGNNRHGNRRWTTISEVVAAEPGARFAFEVVTVGTRVARWEYEIAAADGGARVTESTWDQRPGWLRIASIAATGVRDRTAENNQNIRRTLERLKVIVESNASHA